MSYFAHAVAALLALAILTCASARADSVIVFESLDEPGEGLNDLSPFTPLAGNGAIILGEARRQALEFAASLWAQSVRSEVTILVAVDFTGNLPGSGDSATLGRGGPTDLFRDFVGAPRPGTWYPAALADRLAGIDLSADTAPDVVLLLNREVDGPVVLGDSGFYYGLDHNAPPGQISFIAVVTHELAHGLGFHTLLDKMTGKKFFGYDDAYMRHLRRRGATPSDFPSMTDTQRKAAITAGANVVWSGPSAMAEAAKLSSGTSPEGYIEMYAPAPVEVLSSLSHFASSVAPNEIQEPFYVEDTEMDFCLTLALFADLGWGEKVPCEAGVLVPAE